MSASLPRSRLKLLLPALAVAAWLAFFGDKTPADVATTPRTLAVPAPPRAAQAPAGAGPVALPAQPSGRLASEPLETLMPRTEWGAAASRPAGRDLFAASSWDPPAPARAPVVAAKPVAPPLPFTYLGMKQDDGVQEVYLSLGEQTLIAREGGRLLDVYRVEKISSASMTLTYLPLGQTQTMPIGDFR